jgi:hypothetical protein
MTDISVVTTSHHVEDRSWYLGTAEMPGFTLSGTLDVSGFTAGTHYPDDYIKSGEPLARTASGLYIPYVNQSNEVVVITRTATGGTVDITFDGETNAGVSIVAATTAAQVKTAFEALSNINVGDITVTGNAGGPFTVTFVAGPYAGINAPDVVIDDTNATGGTVLAAITDGGVESPAGEGTGVGFLFSSVKVPNTADTTINVGCAVLVAFAPILEAQLPRAVDAAFRADVPNLYYIV